MFFVENLYRTVAPPDCILAVRGRLPAAGVVGVGCVHGEVSCMVMVFSALPQAWELAAAALHRVCGVLCVALWAVQKWFWSFLGIMHATEGLDHEMPLV